MSLRTYEIIVRDCNRGFLTRITDEYSVDWIKKLNEPGSFELEFARDACTIDGRRIRTGDITRLNRIDLISTTRDRFGNIGERGFVGSGPWFVESISSSGGTVTVKATNGLGLLERRYNLFDSETSPGLLAAGQTADDAMKLVMRENYGPLAASYIAVPDPVRNASTILTIDPDLTAGPVIDETQAANQTILSVLQKLSNISFSLGTPLFFDLFGNQAAVTPPYMTFATFVRQRGTDRRQQTGPGAVILTEQTNTLDAENYTLSFDFRRTINRQYGGGSERGMARDYTVAEEENLAALIADCPFELREGFTTVSSDDIDQIQSDVDAELQGNLADLQFEGRVIDGGSYVYGQDYGIGDRITAIVEGLEIGVFVTQEEGNLQNGEEDLEISVSNSLQPDSTNSLDFLMRVIRTQQARINKLESIEIPA